MTPNNIYYVYIDANKGSFRGPKLKHTKTHKNISIYYLIIYLFCTLDRRIPQKEFLRTK